ncbi:unnamed protein product, partial [Discosporangium mesarthrocarpum]
GCRGHQKRVQWPKNSTFPKHAPQEVSSSLDCAKVYVTKGWREPSAQDHDWSSVGTGTGNVARLQSWEIADGGDERELTSWPTHVTSIRLHTDKEACLRVFRIAGLKRLENTN